jgi:hypothetical protein
VELELIGVEVVVDGTAGMDTERETAATAMEVERVAMAAETERGKMAREISEIHRTSPQKKGNESSLEILCAHWSQKPAPTNQICAVFIGS